MPSGTTIGSAFVQIIPSTEGITSKLADALSPLSSQANKQGELASENFLSGFKAKAIVGAAAGGLLIGGLLAKSFTEAASRQAENAQLAAKLGLDSTSAAALGKVAGSLYADNFGDSFSQVNDALALVQQNIGGMLGSTDDALEKTAGGVLNLSNTFGQDLERTTGAVGTLLKTGLAADASEALDILTVGFQTGANKADDLLDTFIEYPTVLKGLGLDAKEATGLLNQGLNAGARNADVVADALKEFQIR